MIPQHYDELAETLGDYGAAQFRYYRSRIRKFFGRKDWLENMTAIQIQVLYSLLRDGVSNPSPELQASYDKCKELGAFKDNKVL